MAKKKNPQHRHGLSTESVPRTLFVCVRNRHGKGRSCAGSGSRALVADAQAILRGEHIGLDELSIRPVGCLGLCERGPICIATAGSAACERKPPKIRKKNLRADKSALVSIEVEPQELRSVLREALLQAT
jgi:predicted metal-binding protein